MTISANFPNVKPSLLLDFANAQQLPPAVTFTRATTAAYYNGSTTAMAEQNLITDSQVLNGAAWLLTNNSVVTANTTTAPDGTLTADTFSATGSSTTTGTPTQVYKMVDGVTGLTYTASIYAKANTSNFVYIREYFSHNTEDVTWFNLSTGALGTTSANHTASIVSVGSGWYRCVITTTVDTTRNQSLGFGVSTANSNYNITTSSSIYLWGAQLEQRNAVTAYTATTTQAITNYVPQLLTAGGGQPRFDHNPTTSESLGLLIEEQRTNINTYSEAPATAGWSLSPASAVNNTIVSPAGTLTGASLTENGSLAYQRMNRAFTILAGTTHTVTVYAKKGLRDWIVLDSGPSAYYNLNTGTVGTVGAGATASMTSVGNGWYRCSYTYTESTTTLAVYIGGSSNGSDGGYYTGVAGYQAFYFWGCQVEAASFATSYIPTASAAATRAADVVSMSGANFSSWYSPGNGTFYAEASTASTASDVMIAEATNSSGAFLDFSLTFATTSPQFINRFVASNNDMRLVGVVAAKTMVKFSGSITNSSGTTLASANGVAMTVSTSQPLLTGADRMFIGSRNGSSLFLNAPIRKLAFYPAQLTQTQQNSITG